MSLDDAMAADFSQIMEDEESVVKDSYLKTPFNTHFGISRKRRHLCLAMECCSKVVHSTSAISMAKPMKL